MAKDCSFDIVSEFDKMELVNYYNNRRRHEIEKYFGYFAIKNG